MLLGLLPMIGPMEAMVLLVSAVLVVWPACRICAKAGFPGPLGLIVMLPGLNIGLMLFLALAEWPALRTARNKPHRPDWPLD
jgi:hypothetical protein